MYKIIEKQIFSEVTKLLSVYAPKIAKSCRPGQFVMIRIDEKGERIPLTIADFDPEKGTISLVFQEIGKSTQQLGALEQGEFIKDVAGPLGHPTHIFDSGTVILVGGGVGVAPIYPIAREFKKAGCNVIGIIGARNKELLFWEEKMSAACNSLYITTDDGSYVRKGFVTDVMKELIEEIGKENIALIMAIGPQPMMRACCNLSKGYEIRTLVSLNALMVDGTGMCGCCRVSVGGSTKFVCVDGPEFDGHQVDWLELYRRSTYFCDEEKSAKDIYNSEKGNHACGCGGIQ
ncbi:MAG: sulfide/dihydroorotate dehydrogenase-like FAD/NAD-binding protein [Peptococcaceae bacterium]|nr:sulfide/dihydroorotate dehydrogenase-like FAD/NAD-binding protein [Peptococcaceae bacterium]